MEADLALVVTALAAIIVLSRSYDRPADDFALVVTALAAII